MSVTFNIEHDSVRIVWLTKVFALEIVKSFELKSSTYSVKKNFKKTKQKNA